MICISQHFSYRSFRFLVLHFAALLYYSLHNYGSLTNIMKFGLSEQEVFKNPVLIIYSSD